MLNNELLLTNKVPEVTFILKKRPSTHEMIAIAVSLYYYGTIANLSIDYGHTPDVRVFPYKGADFEVRIEEWGSTSFDIFLEMMI